VGICVAVETGALVGGGDDTPIAAGEGATLGLKEVVTALGVLVAQDPMT
jgi:hypothetical protein